MESLTELIPGIGDAIRIGRLSFQIGEMIGKYLTEKEEEVAGLVTWRYFHVFLKENTHSDITGTDFCLIIATWGLYLIYVLFYYIYTCVIFPENIDDIEVTYSDYKMIRKNDGRMGVCRWSKYTTKCRLLLPTKYTIIKGFDNSYIVKDENGLYGLYNAELETFVANCEYDSIMIYSANTYLWTKGESISLMNAKGDRI